MQVKPILAEISCKFIKALYFPSQIVVGARTDNLQTDRFEMHYGIFLKENKDPIAKGSSIIKCFDANNKRKK